VGGLSGDSYLPELSDKYYNNDGVSVAGIKGPPATDPDLAYLLYRVYVVIILYTFNVQRLTDTINLL